MERNALPLARRSALACLLVLAACAVNPATGARELSFIGESQEIALGREADADIVRQMGLYPDSAVQRYVSDLGLRLAAVSERPDLPWTFRVLDDPAINAFALPGGYIYVTRGILTHMTSEAQLAGVLGHEIGHVTAKHSVNRMSRAQLAQVGLGVGMILSENVRRYAGLAQQSLGLLFLSFGRDDELQADALGLRYMTREGYDPQEMAGVMAMLDRSSRAAGDGGRLPEWLSTHPNPENRIVRIRQEIDAHPQYAGASTVSRAAFLERIDAMTFGSNPREGFVEEGVFHHPDLAFRFPVPQGWQVQNGREAVTLVAPEGAALLQLTLSSEAPEEGLAAFRAQEGVTVGTAEAGTVQGLPTLSAPFSARTQDGELRGRVSFIRYQERTYAFLAYSTASGWGRYADAAGIVVGGFGPETDGAVLAVDPFRLDVVRIPAGLSLADFVAREPSTVSDQVVALINQVESGEALPGGLAKRVVGGR